MPDEMEKDDAWLKSHLEEMVDRYAHKVGAILDQEVVGVGSGGRWQRVEAYRVGLGRKLRASSSIAFSFTRHSTIPHRISPLKSRTR
jgi:hypothetical protein